jgi:hypothetical protein
MRTMNLPLHCLNQPMRLSENEKQHPHEVVEDFFSCFHLEDIREIMWDWLVAAMSCDSGQFSSGYDRSNLIFVYEKLELFIEAAHVINKRRRQRQKRETRKRNRQTGTNNKE